jgi:hypothetical protein
VTPEEKAEQLRGLMQSPVWTQVLVPMVQGRIKRYIMMMKDRSEKRKKEAPDDYIAGAWDEAEAWLKDPLMLVRDWDQQVAMQADEDRQNDTAIVTAAFGRHSPYTGSPLTGPPYTEGDPDGG